jgi:hypothetical protein
MIWLAPTVSSFGGLLRTAAETAWYAIVSSASQDPKSAPGRRSDSGPITVP